MTPSIVPKGPWTTSLNWDLHATLDGETRTPFRHHIRAGQQQTDSSNGNFLQFWHLPLELQQHVFSFCDGATLWQLMRMSSTTRDEAKKLFWSDPTTRYHIYGWWLLAGGFPGHTHDDLEALARMQYVEVDFDGVISILSSGWEDGELKFACKSADLPKNYAEQQTARFWTTLRRRFPRIIDVVLSDERSDKPGAPAPNELTQLAEGSPQGISTGVSCFQLDHKRHARPMSRHLWRQSRSDGNPSTWEVVDAAWTRRSVLPPLKEHSGPVGQYRRLIYEESDHYMYSHYARQLLSIQATEAYYLHTRQAPCVCPFPDCGLQFKLPGQWAAHYVSADAAHEGDVPLPPCETLRAAFEHHDMSMKLMLQRIDDERARMREEWGDVGSQQRNHVKKQFLQQLRDDALYAGEKAPEESSIWRHYQRDMDDKLYTYG